MLGRARAEGPLSECCTVPGRRQSLSELQQEQARAFSVPLQQADGIGEAAFASSEKCTNSPHSQQGTPVTSSTRLDTAPVLPGCTLLASLFASWPAERTAAPPCSLGQQMKRPLPRGAQRGQRPGQAQGAGARPQAAPAAAGAAGPEPAGRGRARGRRPGGRAARAGRAACARARAGGRARARAAPGAGAGALPGAGRGARAQRRQRAPPAPAQAGRG